MIRPLTLLVSLSLMALGGAPAAGPSGLSAAPAAARSGLPAAGRSGLPAAAQAGQSNPHGGAAGLPARSPAGLAALWLALGMAQEANYAGRFRVYTSEGDPATLEDIVEAMRDVDAVLVGEIHTDPVGHWIEAELLGSALAEFHVAEDSGALRTLALSMEMFERDVQEVVDEYMGDFITESQFLSSARPWEFYTSDYRPMVEMAKASGIRVIAANAPRRYVNRVSRLGRESLFDLPSVALRSLPPLPYPPPTDAYRQEWTTLMAEMPMEPQCEPPESAEAPEGHVRAEPPKTDLPHPTPPAGPPAGMPTHGGAFMENGLQAQALWDASMAYAVTTFLETHPGSLVFHVVGGFHVQNHTGIPEAIEFYRPGTRTLVVSMDTADDFENFDPEQHAGRGDFVILTDKRLDLDYARNCSGS